MTMYLHPCPFYATSVFISLFIYFHLCFGHNILDPIERIVQLRAHRGYIFNFIYANQGHVPHVHVHMNNMLLHNSVKHNVIYSSIVILTPTFNTTDGPSCSAGSHPGPLSVLITIDHLVSKTHMDERCK